MNQTGRGGEEKQNVEHWLRSTLERIRCSEGEGGHMPSPSMYLVIGPGSPGLGVPAGEQLLLIECTRHWVRPSRV